MSYQKGAMKFYDLFGEKEDASFYISLARKHGKKALELGVGTARLAIQLARSGSEVWGIDNSIYMLKVAEKKLSIYLKKSEDAFTYSTRTFEILI